MSKCSTERAFPTLQVIAAITGLLVCDIGAVYEVLNWMTGENLYTHQLPRVGREAAPVVLALHPELSSAVKEASLVNRENWQEWAAQWLARYGETLTVPKMAAAEHERIDPFSELAEKVRPENIIIVDPDKGTVQ